MSTPEDPPRRSGSSANPFGDVDIEFVTPRRRPGEADRELEAPDFVATTPPREDGPTPVPEQPPAQRRRARSETALRVLVALPLIAMAVTIVVVGGPLFAVAMIGFSCAAMLEFFSIVARARPFATVGFAVAAALVAAAYLGDHYEMMLVALVALPLMFLAGALRHSTRGLTLSFALTGLAVLWIGLPFAHAVLLRELPDHGAGLLLDVLVATFLADTAAYAGGRLIGRHRLAPVVSPNKTVEGLACGFVGGTLGFWFAGLYQDWLPGLDALVMGAAIAAVAPIGDLFQSMIKRDLDVKDAGSIFGPHGGVLDRLDAVLFTVVAGYYLSVAFLY